MIVYKREQMSPSKHGVYPNIESLYNTIPRDTREHMERVGRYSDNFYRQLWEYIPQRMAENFDEDFSAHAKELFQMHDLGRAYIPVSVLNKTSALTEEERQLIKNHTIFAATAVESVYRFPYQDALLMKYIEIALYHHERYDGGGYPEGKRGEDIPLAAQICGIADTYDGITSWKPYKPKQTTKEQAAEIILKERGKQFAPELAEYFVDILQKHPLQFE